jgi:uncharacterized protein
MRKFIIIIIAVWLILTGSYFFINYRKDADSPLGQIILKPKPLLVYTFENLRKTIFPRNQIILGREISETDTSISQIFYFDVPKRPNSQSMLKVSGLINIPKKSGTYPVIIMLHGFVPQNIFTSGVGTQRAGELFVKNGLITIAPDFLGYGESASPSADPFEDRFQTYTTVLTLFSSVSTLNSALAASYSGSFKVDLDKIGLWGHSNGGHIALATLAISGARYPTVLWAPVSKSFPYSILYYTDEFDDQGKALRKALASFEADYDTDLFSPVNYYSWIKAPLEIHQGLNDQEVPVWWSNELVDKFKNDNFDIKYYTYPDSDHNLMPSGWATAVTKSLEFYQREFSK